MNIGHSFYLPYSSEVQDRAARVLDSDVTGNWFISLKVSYGEEALVSQSVMLPVQRSYECDRCLARLYN